MAREIEHTARELLKKICGPECKTPDWLMRPGRFACRTRWPLVQDIYFELTGNRLPKTMPPRERRKVDGVFLGPGDRRFIFKLDEKQRFNRSRAATLRLYPDDLRLGFSVARWMECCCSKGKLEGGGFAKPKLPLFPVKEGRHRQRAFRDALADVLPSEHGFLPTLRLGDIEVRDWIFKTDAQDRMACLIET